MELRNYRIVLGLLVVFTVFIVEKASAQKNVAAGGLVNIVNNLGHFLDKMAVNGIDTNYISVPKDPWQVMVKTNLNQVDLKMNARWEYEDEGYGKELMNITPRFKDDVESSIGVWAGYRGYGLGYSFVLGESKSHNLALGATGGSYGLNLRYHRFTTDETEVRIWGDYSSGEHIDETQKGELPSPATVRSLVVDGHYFFNGKRFSYAAAYDQSAIQKRSAGSFCVGLMWMQACIDYRSRENSLFVALMNGIGRLKMKQGSLGAGYAYNWVPCSGWLVSAMVMPMVTCYQRVKAYRYNLIFTGDPNVPDEDLDLDDPENFDMEFASYDNYRGKLSLEYDARLSLLYSWGRCFVNVFGQFNNYRYRIDDSNGHLNDWYVNASFGVRF